MAVRVIQHIKEILEHDSHLKKYVSTNEFGDLNVCLNIAPKGTSYPYVMMSFSPMSGSYASNRTYMSIDVYADNNDMMTASVIADRVTELLDGRSLPTDIGALIVQDGPNIPIPNEADPSVFHINSGYIVRYNRAY